MSVLAIGVVLGRVNNRAVQILTNANLL